ncbi:MAG TPA: TetR/AcrR family transcriptional regulator [Deltaproteobacteria bacterium]|nr:TetR/AcrR family transcriptional regulator [Deltaproteobacteria bacterium]
MPRTQRTPEQVQEVKGRIIERAVELMNRLGYRDFSMRGLARELKVSPPTLYTYFHDKDELYLRVLTEGFRLLRGRISAAYESAGHPMERMRAMAEAYVDFGLENAHFYNLMFTWHVPKYKDYLGTPVEGVAAVELETALDVARLVTKAIRECAGPGGRISDRDAGLLLVSFWSTLHGYIAGINNTLLSYMHENPLALRNTMVDLVHGWFVREVDARRLRCEGTDAGDAGRGPDTGVP